MRSFASDNYASIHPKILKSIESANFDHSPAYGADKWTKELNVKIKEIFGPQAEAFPVFNGTGANVIALTSILKSYEAVLCTQEAHINVDECGALERLSGNKIIDVFANRAKLSVADLEPFTKNFGNEHQAQAKVLALTQSTERGTLYSLNELRGLSEFCSLKQMNIFIDGARFANAVAALRCNPLDMIKTASPKVMTLGGTKNGLAYGDLIVSFCEELAVELKFLRKQYMQLSSKMRFVSAQFCTYFDDSLWIKNALHANEMAQVLYQKVIEIEEVQVSHKPEANALFVKIPRKIVSELQKAYPFYIWDESTCEARWMCSFDTSEKDIDAFVSKIKELSR